MILYIILGAIAVVFIWGIFMYNRFIALINNSKEAWADIDTQLKRRYDLIPNLVETASSLNFVLSIRKFSLKFKKVFVCLEVWVIFSDC